jgi:hypothetical protein
MKQLLTAFLLFQFSFLNYAMESIYSVSSDVLSLIFSSLSWRDKHNLSLTSMRLRALVQAYNEKQSALKKITSFTKPKSTPIVFCCSGKTFCILQEDGSNKLGFRTHIKMFDGTTLEERNADIDLSLNDNHFTSCARGICYSQAQKIAYLSVDDDQTLSEPIINYWGISRLECFGDEIVIFDEFKEVTVHNHNGDNVVTFPVLGRYVFVYNIVSEVRRNPFIKGEIEHVSALNGDIFLFGRENNNLILSGAPILVYREKNALPIIACANNSNFIITCHIDEKSAVQVFYKNIVEYNRPTMEKMLLNLPLSIKVTKLFLLGNNLLITANINDNNWLVVIYSVTDEQRIFSKKFKELSEIHPVGNHIFLIFKSSDDDARTENFEIIVISLDHL